MKHRRVFDEGAACACAAGGGLAALLAAQSKIGVVAEAISKHLVTLPTKAPRLEPSVAFLVAMACALVGVVGALVAHRPLARRGKGWVAALAVLVLVGVLGALRMRWLAYAAPIAVVAVGPLFATGSVHPASSALRDARDATVCLACEAACLGVGAWLPFAGPAAALLLPAMVLPAAVAVYMASTQARAVEQRWRIAFAGLPALGLPMVGLLRNPSLLPTLACVLAAPALAWLLGRRPPIAGRAAAWARRHAMTFAIPALTLVLVLPWHFRELGMADYRGHEGQHLGWINSISFGKLMMADAGFTYGPAREYTLALLTWLQGGLTLEHVRIAHVLVNVVGFVCIFAAMRRVAAGQGYLLVVGVLLLLTHSVMVFWVVYTTTYSFGWADASRAGLATLSVVVVLLRRTGDPRASRRSLLAGGALAAFATLYSHDFGLPAVLATFAGLAMEVLCRRGATLGVRARTALRSVGGYAVGLAAVIVPFLAVYAVRGRLGAFFQGYAWTIQVSGSNAPFEGRTLFVTRDTFASYGALMRESEPASEVGAMSSRVLDYVMGPALAIMGVAHVTAAIVRRRFVQRTALVAALSILGTMTMHHAFLTADPWHIANATTPGLVMLVALAAGARRLSVRVSRGRVLSVGALCAALVPVIWLTHGAVTPLNARLASIASGEERPSVGARYEYPDVPRVGDVKVGNEHLAMVRYVREHSWSDDPVFCATWALGGGTEAFLSVRRNPTSFDKPDEVASSRYQRRLLDELQHEPPRLIVGHHFDEFGDDVRALIEKDWHMSSYTNDRGILEHNR